jgi:propionyl-CoA carboxylase beta chain
MGPCAGGPFIAALTELYLYGQGRSHMFITGPQVIKAVTHEEVTFEDLGGSMVHNANSGVAHFCGGKRRAMLDRAFVVC